MTDQTPDSKFLKIVGSVIVSALGAMLGWLTGGSGYLAVALTTVLAVVGGISALAFSIMYRRFLGVVASGGARKGSPARAAYDDLRESLSRENGAAHNYTKLLRAFLDWIERFFHDVGMADRTLFPHAFGLKNPAPLWTAPAFDRCLQLALIYPIVTIVLIWAISGHVGPAEAALGLPPGTFGWRRAAGVALIFLGCYAWVRYFRSEGVAKNFAWTGGSTAIIIAVYLVVGLAGVVTCFAVAIAVCAFSGVGDFFVDSTSEFTGVGTLALTLALFFAFAGFHALIFAFAGAGATAVAGAAGFAGAMAFAAAVIFLNVLAIRRQQHGKFLAVYVATALALIIELPAFLASHPAWHTFGPVLVYIGLLTVINAPFDWASLGLTRALLRRGLELGGWWPYLFALMDAALAAVIITLLAATMVIGVQAFDTVAIHSGGKPVLPLRELFDGVATRPSEPEYWWLYALLLSSMIPSLLNLAIGGIAFLRGIPGLRSVLLGFLPAGKAVAPFDRAWIALVLTAQVFAGIALGVAAQAFLSIGIIGDVLPWFGLHILDVARDIADFNLPERVWR